MKAKILLGCPTCDLYEYCLFEYLATIKELSYNNYDILLVDNSKNNRYSDLLKQNGINVIKDEYKERAIDRIVSSRNILRKYAIDNNYDYLLIIEQDVIPPKDVIEKLLNHNKNITAGVYFTQTIYDGKKEIVPMLYKQYDEEIGKMRYFTQEELTGNLEEARNAGLGCMLISKEVLEKINFRYIQDKPAFDDVWFANDIRKLGYKIYADTRVKCKHLILKRPWTWGQLK